MRPCESMGGIVIAIWEKSNFFGSIGSLKCTKNAIFLQGGQNLPPLPLVGLKQKDGGFKWSNWRNKTKNIVERRIFFLNLKIYGPSSDSSFSEPYAFQSKISNSFINECIRWKKLTDDTCYTFIWLNFFMEWLFGQFKWYFLDLACQY